MFTGFTFIGRTKKCVILENEGHRYYCLYPVFHRICHDPTLEYRIIKKKHPKNGEFYYFINLFY